MAIQRGEAPSLALDNIPKTATINNDQSRKIIE